MTDCRLSATGRANVVYRRLRRLFVTRKIAMRAAALALAACAAAPAAQASTVTVEGDKVAIRGTGSESTYFLIGVSEYYDAPGVKWLQISNEAAISSYPGSCKLN